MHTVGIEGEFNYYICECDRRPVIKRCPPVRLPTNQWALGLLFCRAVTGVLTACSTELLLLVAANRVAAKIAAAEHQVGGGGRKPVIDL